MLRTFVFRRKAARVPAGNGIRLSSPKILHKSNRLVIITACEKVGTSSKSVASFYVNQKLNSHNPGPVWITLVEKLVDNVENCELSTGIPLLSAAPAGVRKDAYGPV